MVHRNWVLYHYWRSSCSWRVRWALTYKNINVQFVAVNLLAAEHRSSNFVHLKNPMASVPVLQVNNQYLTQSLAIIEWLEEQGYAPFLLPVSSMDRYCVRQLSQIIACDTQPIQNLSVQKYVSSDPAQQKAFACQWIERGLAAYEALVIKYNGGAFSSYSYGHELTLADICLVPQCYNAERFGVDLQKYPHIHHIYQNCRELDHCKQAAPESFAP